jgi:putative oxidoreductase
MFAWLFQTNGSAAGLFLRLTLAVVMFPHGAQKVLGWFGGQGLMPTLQSFISTGIPPVLAWLVVAAEFLGPLALAVGLLTRLAAFGIAGVMLGAIKIVHWKYGFFMNWSGTQPGEGFEYHLLALGIAIALLIMGGGAWSADRALSGSR